MAEPIELPKACLRDLVHWLRAAKVRGVIIGGIAASLLGRPRITRDVDALVSIEADWQRFLEIGQQCGFRPRIDDPVEFAEETRVLLMRHEESAVDVDLMLAALPFEQEVIRRSAVKRIAGIPLPLPTPSDLVIMKAVANRPRDMADIEGILDAHPRLRRERILRIVGEFAALLERPDVLSELQSVFAKSRRQ